MRQSKIRSAKANIRHPVLETFSLAIEPTLTPQVPNRYQYPFLENECMYCETFVKKMGRGDHFVPVTYGGRTNRVNIVWCCSSCNSSKGSRMDTNLMEWLERAVRPKRRQAILDWLAEHEKYMHVPKKVFEKADAKLSRHQEWFVQFMESEIEALVKKKGFTGERVGGRYARGTGFVQGTVQGMHENLYIIHWDDGLEEELLESQVKKRLLVASD